jgi:hypothetical protein
MASAKSINDKIKALETEFKNNITSIAIVKQSIFQSGRSNNATAKKALEKRLKDLIARQTAIQIAISSYKNQLRTITVVGGPGVAGTGASEVTTIRTAIANQDRPKKAKPDGMAKVNLSACRELYFRSEQSFLSETVAGVNNVPDGSQSFTSYKKAKELWEAGKASKGMIQTWEYPKGTADTALVNESNKTPTNPFPGKHAFQFQYNPGSINMSYNGFPDIDISMYINNPPKVNAYGTAGSKLSFTIILNRMPDMKYIDATSKDYKRKHTVKKEVGNFSGLLKTRFVDTQVAIDYSKIYNREPYIDKTTGRNELKDIYNKGTMYDVDHLLRVMMGFTLQSQLRGKETTADIGWLNPQPIELHLGAGLRYLVSISELNIDHVIFNERMVPLFSTVSITANRIPDWDDDSKALKNGSWN